MRNLIPTIRGAAHDIRGLLASATLATDSLSEHEDSQVNLRAKAITKAINQIVEICNTDLIEPCVAEKKEMLTASDVRTIVDQVSFLISPHDDSKLGLPVMRVDIDDNVGLSCNRAYLFRVIYNLLVNAAKAIRTSSGTTIKVKIETDGELVKIHINDNGPGLPQHIIGLLYPNLGPDDQTGVFSSYGLMTTIAMVHEMNGQLHLLHTSEVGTKFCVILPKS